MYEETGYWLAGERKGVFPMALDTQTKTWLESLPEEDVQEVFEVLSHRIPTVKRPLNEVLRSLSTLRNSLQKQNFDSVGVIREGREER